MCRIVLAGRCGDDDVLDDAVDTALNSLLGGGPSEGVDAIHSALRSPSVELMRVAVACRRALLPHVDFSFDKRVQDAMVHYLHITSSYILYSLSHPCC